MKYVTAMTLFLVSFTVAACGAAVPELDISNRASESAGVTADTTGMGSDESLTEEERAAIEAARQELSSRQASDKSQFSLVSVRAVEWGDSSLGCPQYGFSYLTVITPGHRVVLRDQDRSYDVRVAGKVVIVCDKAGMLAPISRPPQAINARTLEKMQKAAQQDLAARFNVPVEDVSIGMAIPAQWPDASLGCPVENEDYPAGVQHGFRLLLTVHNRSIFYHTDGHRVFPCPVIENE